MYLDKYLKSGKFKTNTHVYFDMMFTISYKIDQTTYAYMHNAYKKNENRKNIQIQ
jgi:hypothetical protein